MLSSTLLLTGFFNIYFAPYFFTLDKYYFVLVGYLSAFHEVLFSCLLKGRITSSSDYNQSNSDLFIHLLMDVEILIPLLQNKYAV